MFPLVKEVDGHRIERRPPGFEFTPGLLGTISTFLVIPPTGRVRAFAFMYSFVAASASDEDRLADEALLLIEDEIAAKISDSEQDRTFEYLGERWREVASPRWWVSVTAPH